MLENIYNVKILTAFLLPAGFIFLFLLFLCIRALFKKEAWGVLLCVTVLFYLLSTNALVRVLAPPLENSYEQTRYPMGDVIVVLGGGAIAGVPDLNGLGNLTGASANRLLMAARVQRKTGLPILISGGLVYKNGAVEAIIAQRQLLELGIASDRIYVDIKSRTTAENALNVEKICENHGWKRIILVTSATHMPRAARYFDKGSLDYETLPCDYIVGKSNAISWQDFLPSGFAFANNTAILKEYLGNLAIILNIH